MSSSRTDLSSGDLNGAGSLLIELVQPDSKPPIIAIVWPIKPSITTTTNFDQIAATCMRLLANASVRLAQLQARGEV